MEGGGWGHWLGQRSVMERQQERPDAWASSPFHELQLQPTACNRRKLSNLRRTHPTAANNKPTLAASHLELFDHRAFSILQRFDALDHPLIQQPHHPQQRPVQRARAHGQRDGAGDALKVLPVRVLLLLDLWRWVVCSVGVVVLVLQCCFT